MQTSNLILLSQISFPEVVFSSQYDHVMQYLYYYDEIDKKVVVSTLDQKHITIAHSNTTTEVIDFFISQSDG